MSTFSTVPSLTRLDENEVVALATPPGQNLYVLKPLRVDAMVRQKAEVQTLGSFKDYLKRMHTRSESVAVYADVKGLRLEGLLDASSNADQPGANAHSVCYALELSREARALREVLKKPMDQLGFLEWLEENERKIDDVGALLTAATNFQSVAVTKFHSAKRLQNGSVSIVYDTSEDQDQGMKMPPSLKVSVPLFQGQKAEALDVLVRYRVAAGSLSFTLVCPRFEEIVLKRAEDMCEDVRTWMDGEEWKGTEPPLFVLGALPTRNVLTAPVTEKLEGQHLPSSVGVMSDV